MTFPSPPSPDALHPCPSGAGSPPDLSDLLLQLQDTVEALKQAHDVSGASSVTPQEKLPDSLCHSPGSPGQENKAKGMQEAEGVLRSWYFPASAVRREEELLRKYHAHTFQDLLEEVNLLLRGMVRLLKNINPDTRFRGYVLISLGNMLEQATTLLRHMHNIYGTVHMVPPEKPHPPV